MPVQNTDIAAQLKRMADLLEIEGANPFRVRAYRNAARTVKGLARPVPDLIRQKEDLTGFPGIGQDLKEKNRSPFPGKNRSIRPWTWLLSYRNFGNIPVKSKRRNRTGCPG